MEKRKFNLSFTYRINKKKNERDKKCGQSKKKKAADFNKKLRTYENGSFFISSGKYFHKKKGLKNGSFFFVNQTKLIALSLLFFL
jgi:hypothetical protein